MKPWLLLSMAALILIGGQVAASEPNPKSYVATASGNNVMLAANTGRGYTIHSITLVACKEATAVVGVRFASTTEDLLGDATHHIPIDKTGLEGFAGFTIPYDPVGIFSAPIGEPVNVVLDAAQPVIVRVTYRLR